MWYLCAYKDMSADIRLLICESVIALLTGVCWCAIHAGSFPMEHIRSIPDGALYCLSDSDPTLLVPGSRNAPYLWLCSESQQPRIMPVDLDSWLWSGLGSFPLSVPGDHIDRDHRNWILPVFHFCDFNLTLLVRVCASDGCELRGLGCYIFFPTIYLYMVWGKLYFFLLE